MQQRRNEVLHAIWLQEQPTGEMIALRLSAKQTKQAGIRATELDALAGDIIGLQKAGFEILDSIPWPARRPPLKRR
jgi:peptide subunit release factor RF-3